MGMMDIVFVPSNDNILKKKCKKNNLFSVSNEISISTLIELIEQDSFKDDHVHEFLEKCDITLCPTPIPPRNPELDERILKLKAEQANAEYRSMTKSFLPQDQSIISFRKDVKSASFQITAVINFFLTVVGSFFFAYKAVEYALPEKNIPAQVMMGIITSTVVALADLFFLSRTI